MTTLEEIRASGHRSLYPTKLLERCDTALVLFAAAFLGKQDAAWIEEAGLTATCVDNDRQRLSEMQLLYPEAWEFVWDDAYEYAGEAAGEWDLVSIDCPSGASFERCAMLVDLWCSLAQVAVVLGTEPGRRITAPDGWRVTRTIRRSPIANWTVLERL